MQPKVSIITVYYNSPVDLLKLEQSMKKYLATEKYEWIVADNASTENLEGQLDSAIYLRLPQNFGFSKANNLAAQKARAPFLFFVNPDCELISDCLTPLVAAMQEAAIAGPRVLNPDRSIQMSFGPTLSIFNEAIQKRRMKREQSASAQKWLREKTSTPFSPGFIGGCALMIRADAFHRLGGFDENFFLYEEDVDLCKRARDAEMKITYVPGGEIIHARNTSVAKEPKLALVEYRKSQRYYYKKHHGFFQLLALRMYHSLLAPPFRGKFKMGRRDAGAAPEK